MTALDFLQIMIRLFLSLLASSALSTGMFIDEKLNNGIFTPPPPGSHDRPIPPEELFEGSGSYPPLTNNHLPGYDNYPMTEDGTPQVRGGFMMPYERPTALSVPTENYPVLPKGHPLPPHPPDWNESHKSRMFDVLDLTYCNMILDGPVPPTADQVPWFCTCSLCNAGSIGPKGDKGDRGLPGPPGSPGSRGQSGPRGQPGFIGQQGMKGQKGDEGIQGIEGPLGPMGRKGDHGFKGDKGNMGLEGMPGEEGPPGPPGECPALCDYVNGHPGEVGLPGAVGPRGVPGGSGEPGTKGEKGDQGALGMPGVPGLNGQKGDHGEQGVCHCMDGAKGADGSNGPPGPKGEKGGVGSQGLVGVSGEKGEKGELGMTGFPGPCSPAIQSGFSAILAVSNPLPNRPVPFSIVIYNVQFHYNPNNGVYRAPVNGTYIFSFNLCVLNKVLKVGLFHNFAPVVKTTGSVNLGIVSQQVVLHLDMGDQVWLQVKDTNSNSMCVNSDNTSTFSGFLLYPDSCDLLFSRDMPDPISGTYSWGTQEEPDNP